MSKMFGFSLLAIIAVAIFFTNCKGTTDVANNITADVVADLKIISDAYAPSSFISTDARVADPCLATSDFATCQVKLIRDYLKIGKQQIDKLSAVALNAGLSLGEIADGDAGTSSDGVYSWNKASSSVWSVLQKGSGGSNLAYFSANAGVFNLKYNANSLASGAVDQKIDATLTYVSDQVWTLDLFVVNNVCETASAKAPTRAHFKISKSSDGLWTGKGMFYFSRWQQPASSVDCSTLAGNSEVAMYADFVGDSRATKVSTYIIPATVSSLGSIAGYDLRSFCSNFTSACGGTGQPTSTSLLTFANSFCSTLNTADVVWSNNCTNSSQISSASFSGASLWTVPTDLKSKTVILPNTL